MCPPLQYHAEYFHCPKISGCYSPFPALSPVNHWFFFLHFCLFCHIVGTIQYVVFSDLFLSLSNVCLRICYVFFMAWAYFFLRCCTFNTIGFIVIKTLMKDISPFPAWLESTMFHWFRDMNSASCLHIILSGILVMLGPLGSTHQVLFPRYLLS